MVRITFVQHDGSPQTVEASIGTTLMETARGAAVRGIEAECGGACSCSTCQVYVADDWVGRLPAPSAMETDLLDFAFEVDPVSSRLSCQIKVTDELDGLRVRVPKSQG